MPRKTVLVQDGASRQAELPVSSWRQVCAYCSCVRPPPSAPCSFVSRPPSAPSSHATARDPTARWRAGRRRCTRTSQRRNGTNHGSARPGVSAMLSRCQRVTTWSRRNSRPSRRGSKNRARALPLQPRRRWSLLTKQRPLMESRQTMVLCQRWYHLLPRL